MPQVTIPHPDVDHKAKTFSTVTLVAGNTALAVQNNGGFAQNDYVVIGAIDSDETAEIKSISSLSGSTTITTNALSFGHASGITITKIKYNQARVYSAATQTGSYSLLTTIDLEPNIPGGTRYDDLTGTSSTWYKVSWYNSYTGLESTKSDPIQVTTGVDGYANNTAYSMVMDVLGLVNDRLQKYINYSEVLRLINIRQQMWWLSPFTKRGLKTTRTYTTTQNQAYVTLDTNFDKLEGDYAVKYHHVIPANGAPVASIIAGNGPLSAGKYYYVITFTIPSGETPAGTPSLVTTITAPTTFGKIQLTNIPVDPTGQATRRNVYRTIAGGSTYYLLDNILDNTTTTYTDIHSDAYALTQASPPTGNPGVNTVDEYYDLQVMSYAQFYETFSDNQNMVPTELLQGCCFYESGTTKQLLLGPTPSTGAREIMVSGFIQPTDLANDTDVTLCPVPRILTLPVAMEILNGRGETEKIAEYKEMYAALIPGEVEHGRKKSGTANLRFRKDYGNHRFLGNQNKTNV